MTVNASSFQNFKKRNKIQSWFVNHARAFISSFSELLQTPIASLMTITVIGVAMALPSGFYLLLENFQLLSKSWNGRPTISLYLKQTSNDEEIKRFQARLENSSDVQSVKYISPDEGLKEFEKFSPFSNLNDILQKNPLPPVLIITPKKKSATAETLKKMLQALQTSTLVDSAELDMAWVERLNDVTLIGKRITYTIAILFCLGVALIIGNTIRLTTQTHRQEINIFKLVGATHAFIQRPFLYRGLWYGLLGGLLAWILVLLILWWLKSPAQHLAESYGNHFIFRGLTLSVGVGIIILSSVMGLIGSWMAVRRHLSTPEVL